MKKNKLILQPGDYMAMFMGLKIENIGKNVIELELPYVFKIYPVSTPVIQDIKFIKVEDLK